MFALKFVNIFVCPILSRNVVNNGHGYRYDVAWVYGLNLFYFVNLLIHQPQFVHDNAKIRTLNNF